MALPLEDYALICNTRTAALVGRGGSIDWLCLPNFDSCACSAALLGDREHGRWQIAPNGGAIVNATPAPTATARWCCRRTSRRSTAPCA